MKKNEESEEKGETIKSTDLKTFSKFRKLPCPLLRRHVWHGLKEEESIQTIECLSCEQKYEFHIEGRLKIEKSLWELYEKTKDTVDLSPPPKKRPKKRWSPKFIFSRG